MTTRVEKQTDGELPDLLNEVRGKLARMGFAFGALFVGHRADDGEMEFGLFMMDDVSQLHRMQILGDLQKTLDASKKAFQI